MATEALIIARAEAEAVKAAETAAGRAGSSRVAAARARLVKAEAAETMCIRALLDRARSWTEGDCSFDHGPTIALIGELADALEGK